jgi:cell division septation protein DedD
MKTKDFREIQVSSTILVVIFLCVLVLGVFVFLLGVSVGKKQVQISSATRVVAQQIQEPAKDEAGAKPSEQPKEEPQGGQEAGLQTATPPLGAGETAAKTELKTKGAANPQKPPPRSTAPPAVKTPSKPAAAGGTGLFFIQVAAFTDKVQAAAEAEKHRKKGYPVVISDPRPTDTKTWYRVRIGGYPTREKAAEVLTKLNEAAKKKTDYRIIKD